MPFLESKKEQPQIFLIQKLLLSWELSGVDGIIAGSYWPRENKIEVYLKLINVKTGENLGTIRDSINRYDIPKNIAFESENLEQVKNTLAGFTTQNSSSLDQSGIKIRVWVDKHKNATYKVGETLKINFRANKDCYIKLYHISASREVQLIYPPNKTNKKIQGGKVYDISDEFEIDIPLGTEIIKAVASVGPFQEVEKDFVVLGKVDKEGKVLRKIKKRGFKIRGLKRKVVEDACIYTVIE